MPMLVYQPQQANPQIFVDFWSERYQYGEEHLYTENIGQDLTEQRILDLFRWKNGRRLSGQKCDSVIRNFANRRGELAEIQLSENAKAFLNRFPKGGAIWRIFWLHCWQPARFPIYDQHVHRAMAFIQGGQPEEIPTYDPRKIDSYIERYLLFHVAFAELAPRSVDKALWTSGKFLKKANFPTALE
jgi:hypothetical protein